MKKKVPGFKLLVCLLFSLMVFAQDEVADKIKAASKNSQAIKVGWNLTEVFGPRLTGSPNQKKAMDWLETLFAEWGLVTKQEPWGGPFRSWSVSRTVVQIKAPFEQTVPSAAFPWSAPTNGPISGKVVMTPMTGKIDQKFKDKWTGKLNGAFIVIRGVREIRKTTSLELQLSKSDLSKMEEPDEACPPNAYKYTLPASGWPSYPSKQYNCWTIQAPEFIWEDMSTQARSTWGDYFTFFKQESVAGMILAGSGGYGILLPQNNDFYPPNSVTPPPSVFLYPEEYNRIIRLMEAGQTVEVEMDIKSQYHSVTTTNLIVDIPAAEKTTEMVIIGAHLDSMHYGQGATDDGAGVVVVAEAMRLFKASGIVLRRNVRALLVTGEEQGRLGSRAYLEKHADELKDVTGYLDTDNGTGKIRGIYVNDQEKPAAALGTWLHANFPDSATLARQGHKLGRSDDHGFRIKGVPSFEFVQDPERYQETTWHTPTDTYDRLDQKMIQYNAEMLASMVIWLANREEKLPRQ